MRARVVIAAVIAALALPLSSSGGTGQGARLYGRYCVMCHGPNGSGITQAEPDSIGAGPLREQTQQRGVGPSLRGVGALAADFYLRTGYMPLQHVGIQPRRSRVVLSDGEIRALVAYVASFGPGPPIPKPQPARGNLATGLHLFTRNCAGCHQVVAQGGYVTGAVAPPLGDATNVQIAQAVRIGPYIMPRFTKAQISDRQLDSLIAYVAYTRNPHDPGGLPIGLIGPVPEGLVTWLIAAVAGVAFCVVIGTRLKRAA
jgi:ubiquinol-cytochrome c reductase cytochrome c subunit